jgi:hypothetical protein
MNAFKHHIALLLAVYSIVFVHDVIPHHHHSEVEGCLLSVACSIGETQGHHHEHGYEHDHNGDHFFFDHQHDGGSHEACHFEVHPVVIKSSPIIFADYWVVSDFQLPTLFGKSMKYSCFQYPRKLLESTKFPLSLRVPPNYS